MLTRTDIETALQYMDSKGLIRLGRPTGKWYQLHCPFHNNGNEKRPSCGCALEEEVRNGVVYRAGFFNCFACGAKHSFGSGIKEILALKGSSIAAHPFLEKYIEGNIDTDDDSFLVPTDLMSGLFNSFVGESAKMRLLAKKDYVSEEELAKYRFTVPYMYQRKLTDEVIAKYDIGFDGKFVPPGRKKSLPSITFPVHDLEGRTLFICRRSIEGKFFHIPEGVEKSVFGIYEIPKDAKEVIICESVFNALTCVVYGHPAVALFGTGTSYEIEQLKKLGVRSYVICLDNDEAGRRGTQKLKKALQKTAMVWTMTVPDDGRDVNDLSFDEFMQCYNNRE